MKVAFLLTIWVCLFGPIMCRTARIYEIHFTTHMATKTSYMMFIKELRNAVLQGTEINGVPVLPPENSVSRPQRFIKVRLSNWMDDAIVIAIDVTNLYVVAFASSTQSYFLRDVPDEAHNQLFQNLRPRNLSFDGSYVQLQRAAGTHRREITLGMTVLNSVIASLSAGVNERGIARGFLVCIQMISEAARFRPIEQMVRDSFSGPLATFNPNSYMLSLENSWGELSTAVQSATSQTSSFDRTIILQDSDGSNFDVNTIRQILFTLGVMKFICTNRNSHIILQVNASTLIRSMPALKSGESCPNSKEPALLIRGRDDMCADVNGGFYHDGNSIILFPCRDNQVNQLWTFKADGTIRSNEKCLVAREVQGTQVTISDCNKVDSSLRRWELLSSGTIRKTISKLVLTATSGTSRSALTVQTNVFNSSQCWLPSQNRQLPVRSIVGLNDLCLHTDDGSEVSLVTCLTNERRQKWAIYPDGTIRPQNRDHCLMTRDGDKLVVVSACTGWDNEHWLFENDGIIRTLQLKMVLDVTDSAIIAYPYNGNPSQIWYLMP
ncbi:hypothetical protein ACFE04_025743 [Oxalis oulophora]